MQSPLDVSFLADTVILLRFFEAQGEVRQANSVVKKRMSAHERTIRELQLGGPAAYWLESLCGSLTAFLQETPNVADGRNLF